MRDHNRKQDNNIKLKYQLKQAQPHHGRGIYEVICFANDFNPNEDIPGVFGLAEDWINLLESFAAGQFVVTLEDAGVERVIGVAISMLTEREPSEPALAWRNMIGDLSLSEGSSVGSWLYGVEKAVHPDFQGMGIGSVLYQAQFDLTTRLNLKGMYAGGMLKGFRDHRDHLSIREYAAKVMNGELFDPTVSVQMRKGFKPRTLIENYVWDHEAEHTGMLIVWDNPNWSGSKIQDTNNSKDSAAMSAAFNA